MNKKHLVYAEDVVYGIMQHPSKTISKGLVKQIVDQVIAEKEVIPPTNYVVMGRGVNEQESMKKALDDYLQKGGIATIETDRHQYQQQTV